MLTAPASRALLGYGPSQFLGVFDTRPDLPPWQAEVHRSLQPIPMPGGATLRWMAPRNTRIDGAGAVQTLAPAFENAIALTLYIGGLDVLPPTSAWCAPYWPGAPIGATRFAFSKAIANVPSLWQMGMAFQRPTQVGQAGAPGSSGQFGLQEQQSGFDWLRLVAGMPALDLLSYAGAPWSEADLGELAGGTRYVAAWLRLWWSRFEGVDTLNLNPDTAVEYYLPWTVSPGRPLAPAHRKCWHCAYPMVPRQIVAADDVWDDGQRLQVSSPVSGQWFVGAENNGDAGDAPVDIGLELRGSTILARTSMAVDPATHGLVINPFDASGNFFQNHGGAGVLSAGYVAGGQQDAMLVHVKVAST